MHGYLLINHSLSHAPKLNDLSRCFFAELTHHFSKIRLLADRDVFIINYKENIIQFFNWKNVIDGRLCLTRLATFSTLLGFWVKQCSVRCSWELHWDVAAVERIMQGPQVKSNKILLISALYKNCNIGYCN